MTSFQKRIRGFTLSLIAILLLIFCSSLYGSLSFLLYRHIDSHLLSSARAQAVLVKKESGELEEKGDDSSRHEKEGPREIEREYEEHEIREAIRASVVLLPNGQVQWRGEGVTFQPGLKPDMKPQIIQGTPVFETFETVGGDLNRRISYPITAHGNTLYILQTQTSLEIVSETLQGLLILLGGVSLGIFACGWFGSNWIAQIALSPLKSLSQTAMQISGKSLGTRVLLHAPYQEFQELAQSFNNMLERLQRVFESQRRFVADAAHELKTPLTAMKGNLEVALQQSRPSEEYREVLANNLGQVERLTQLTKSLLTLAQFAGDRPPVDLKPLSLQPLLKTVVSELAVLGEDKGCHLVTSLQEVPQVLGDRAQLQQLVINLLDNAIRHTPKGEMVTVKLELKEDSVLLTVEDSGPGIDPKHLPHLFNRFYRVDSARDRKGGGAGLGLAIAKEISLAHGGTLEVQSEVGMGTTFLFSLPIVPVQLSEKKLSLDHS
jgi:heavy metal sensor kinase